MRRGTLVNDKLPIASGAVTQANMKLSAAAGAAFFDFGVNTIKIGSLIKIRDSAGRAIQGFVKEAGTGEGLGDEVLDDTGFADTLKWAKDTGWTVAANSATALNAVSGTGTFQTKATTVGALYKNTYVISTLTATKAIASFISKSSAPYTGILFGIPRTTTGTYSDYITALFASSYIGVIARTSTTSGIVTSLSSKQVFTPSATGFTISSTKGGTAMDNWSQKDAAFNYNDASGYTYEVYRVLNAPAVLTSSVTAGNALVDSTDANSFIAPVGVDLTPYQDGRHIAHLTDSSGNVAFGWISATAPSGLDTTEIITGADDRTFASDTGWWSRTAGTDINTTTAGKAHWENITNGGWGLYKSGLLTGGRLYQTNATISGRTKGYIVWELSNSVVRSPIMNADGTYQAYLTADNTGSVNLINRDLTGTTLDADNVSLLRITMPASTGALILNRQAGSRGFTYKSASWDANKAQTMKILFAGE